MSDDGTVFRVPPFSYIHVLDNNANVTRVERGPQTFTKQEHEKIVLGPAPMIVVPPRHYCSIKDPAVRQNEKTKEPVTDNFGQVKLRHGDEEIRFSDDWPDPFPLLPGEKVGIEVKEIPLVKADTALRLIAKRDVDDVENDEKVSRKAGDEWMFTGPATYRPRVEIDILETVIAHPIKPDQALKLRARRAFTDRTEKLRKAGEEWLWREQGSYLPSVDEEVLGPVEPVVLLQTRALHLRAADSFTDVYKVNRKAGEEWLVTVKESELHIQDVHEQIVGPVNVTVLNKLQYCVVLDPVGRDGRNQYGSRERREGERSFFLQPGERLEDGIKDVYVLGSDEALLLKARESFLDQRAPLDNMEFGELQRTPGDLWMVRGPCDYVPLVEVEVVEKRKSIALDENEGIYVRDAKTGRVRAVKGPVSYMLTSYEELWSKDLPEDVEALLSWSYYKGVEEEDKHSTSGRDKTRVVVFRVPHNAAVQIYDYKAKKSRVVFGPGLCMLEPDEQFTVLTLSGDKPKRPGVIKSLALMLGPDFMTDIIEVETSDHARLRLQLSYNWHFDVDKESKDEEEGKSIFQVRDFVGDACKAIASRVRGAVAGTSFDQFHMRSAKLIRGAVFGIDEATGKIGDNFLFAANRLMITNIDIQSVEPVDERTRESLQKSVQLAIEITTRKQERNARHAAQSIEQDAKGKIERQKIVNQTEAEEARQELARLQSESAAVASTGTAKAEAAAKAEYLEIEAKADVDNAKLQAEASSIEGEADLLESAALKRSELEHEASMAQLELSRAKRLADIETQKFKALVDAIKPQTIKAIASAGPEMQARLLKGLGLKGYLLTDGNSPVNLFNAARGMVGGPTAGGVGFSPI